MNHYRNSFILSLYPEPPTITQLPSAYPLLLLTPRRQFALTKGCMANPPQCPTTICRKLFVDEIVKEEEVVRSPAFLKHKVFLILSAIY